MQRLRPSARRREGTLGRQGGRQGPGGRIKMMRLFLGEQRSRRLSAIVLLQERDRRDEWSSGPVQQQELKSWYALLRSLPSLWLSVFRLSAAAPRPTASAGSAALVVMRSAALA